MIIAPSVLSIDYLKIKEQLAQLEKSKAEWIHYDIMDGHFVPNMTFGPDFVQALKDNNSLVVDIHLMVEEPMKISKYFLRCKPKYLTIHYENKIDFKEFVDFCQMNDIIPGLSIKPETEVSEIKELLPMFGLILVMTVSPGFGNQKFMENGLTKIRELKALKGDYLIEVDGGINQETAILCKEAGADVLVAGSYVFNGDIVSRVESLL